MTSFVGRDREIADLEEVGQDARLITLTGPGGIGKTSLAIELARVLGSRFRGRGVVREPRRRSTARSRSGGDRSRDRHLRRPRAVGGIRPSCRSSPKAR